jgi:hypothetical protein
MLSASQATHSLFVLSVISTVLAVVTVTVALTAITMRTSLRKWAESSSATSKSIFELMSAMISRGVEHHISHFPANVDRGSRRDKWH